MKRLELFLPPGGAPVVEGPMDPPIYPLRPEQDVWAPERLGAGACASEILGARMTSNVYVITGTRYFHQSNFHFKHRHFHPEKIYLLRIVCIDPASISVNEGLFSSRQHKLRNNSLQASQG